MVNDNKQEIMNDEIKKRLESKNWNLEIAQKVHEKKNAAKSKIITGAFTVTLAAAASIIALFLFQFIKLNNIDTYDQYIDTQVEGTYSYVFGNTENTENADDIDDVDILIEDTMDSR